MEHTNTDRVKQKRTDPVAAYEEYAQYQFATTGEAGALRETRQVIFDLGIERDDINVLDEIVIEAALVNDYVANQLLADDDTHPLAHWWWHLGKIRAHQYPAEQLPEPLRRLILSNT